MDRPGAAGRRVLTKRGAEAWLRDVLDQARGGALPGMVEVIGDHTLRLTFEDGLVGDVSFDDRE